MKIFVISKVIEYEGEILEGYCIYQKEAENICNKLNEKHGLIGKNHYYAYEEIDLLNANEI